MRGKKSDPIFVSEFIRQSVLLGYESQEDIAGRARQRIQEIEDQIRKVEELRLERSKLLDVVAALDRPKVDKSEDAKLLPFFKLEYPNKCQFVCNIVKTQPIEVGEKGQVLGCGDPDPPMKFAIKQLIECKVLARVGNHVIRGDRFDDYMAFIVREA